MALKIFNRYLDNTFKILIISPLCFQTKEK